MTIGLRTVMTICAVALVDAMPSNRTSIGAALNDTAQEVGTSIGTAVVGTLIAVLVTTQLPAGTWSHDLVASFFHGERITYAVLAVLVGLIAGARRAHAHRLARHGGAGAGLTRGGAVRILGHHAQPPWPAAVVTGMIGARDATPLPRAAKLVGVLAWALVELLSFLLWMWAALGWRCDESCNDNLVPEVRSGGWAGGSTRGSGRA